MPVAAAPTALPELPVVAAGSGQSRVISGREEEERGTVGAPGVGGERGIMETGEGGERKFISSEELAQSRLSRQGDLPLCSPPSIISPSLPQR